ncbi:hypothetical protein Y032_0068g157 [Ancylostoma ceylanicum]|uniref:Uncharacterized protein n=1 Tax=Ancylostoma ceylanicum TaxID=53326 RepID=A0A016TYG3_9BILA|nr:hypothetical protein Y032_0068g157 [Ancylostoma ceylanicum]
MANEKTVEVSAHGAETSEAPSAPPIVHAEVQRSDNDNFTPTGTSVVNPHENQTQPSASGGQGSSPYSEPPPSYQMAVGYPTTPYPTHGLQHMPTPGIPPVYAPKPHQMYSPQPNQPPIYYATHAVGVTQFPQGERIPVTTAQVVVAVGNGFTCPHCVLLEGVCFGIGAGPKSPNKYDFVWPRQVEVGLAPLPLECCADGVHDFAASSALGL